MYDGTKLEVFDRIADPELKKAVRKAVIFGSEGDGMGRLVRECCDFIVSLPMKGQISSLNASNAAAITMYEILRQRMAKSDG